jgi:hypothetical protein
MKYIDYLENEKKKYPNAVIIKELIETAMAMHLDQVEITEPYVNSGIPEPRKIELKLEIAGEKAKGIRRKFIE